MKTSKQIMAELTKTALMPQEEMLEVGKKKGKLYIYSKTALTIDSFGNCIAKLQKNNDIYILEIEKNIDNTILLRRS